MGLTEFTTAAVHMAFLLTVLYIGERLTSKKQPQLIKYGFTYLVGTPILMYINANYS